MGRRTKTINNYFCEAETAQSNDPAKLNLFLSDAYRLRYIALFVVYDRRIANYATVENCWSEYASLAEAAIFVYAFRLGAQMTLDALHGGGE